MVRPQLSKEEHKLWLRRALRLEKIKRKIKELESTLKEDVYDKSPDFFVSSSWPSLYYGPFVGKPFEKTLEKNYEEIITELISYVLPRRYGEPYSKIQEELQLSALSQKPVFVEAKLNKKPLIKPLFSRYSMPFGASARLISFQLAEEPKIPKKVDTVMEEKLPTTKALKELRDLDIYYLQRLFSAGIMGRNPHLVPTRWSITAVDDILSKFNIDEIKDYKILERPAVGISYKVFNRFVVVFLPGIFEFENFEAWAPKTTWGAKKGYYITAEYENLRGRKNYADSQAGAYYAVRWTLTEYLKKIRRQARIIVIREVYEGYVAPLGVWQVRENVKLALKKLKFFDSVEESFNFAEKFLRLPLSLYLRKSRLLRTKTLV